MSTGIHAFGRDVRVLRILVAINYLYESAVTGSSVGTDFTHFDASEAQKDDPVIPGRMDADFVAAVDRLSPRRAVHHWLRHRSIYVHRLVASVFCSSAMHMSEEAHRITLLKGLRGRIWNAADCEVEQAQHTNSTPRNKNRSVPVNQPHA